LHDSLDVRKIAPVRMAQAKVLFRGEHVDEPAQIELGQIVAFGDGNPDVV
jgi:hypothetical protein